MRRFIAVAILTFLLGFIAGFHFCCWLVGRAIDRATHTIERPVSFPEGVNHA